MLLPRPAALYELQSALHQFPVVALLGARQVGKTTLARELRARWPGPVTHLDLEDPADLARLAEPSLTLREYTGLVVIDEVQRRPDLFPLLRVLADRPGTPARFLLLGSASPELSRHSSESLAGRVASHRLEGFHLGEVGAGNLDVLWERGGFPGSFLAPTEVESFRWRQEFVQTFLERDVPQLGVRVAAPTLRRFWAMLAHYHGQIWNGSEVSRAFDVSRTAVQHYLDLLTGTFLIRQLQPWHENVAKRQVKAPKIYFTDSGLLHTLLQVGQRDALLSHPRMGASWEGFALHEVLAHVRVRPEESFFWAAHTGAELDLLIVRGQQRVGFEFKRTDAPKTTRSLRAALEILRLDALWVVHAGLHEFPLADGIRALPLRRVTELDPSSLRLGSETPKPP